MDGGTVSQEPISKHFLNKSNGPNHEGPIIYKKASDFRHKRVELMK